MVSVEDSATTATFFCSVNKFKRTQNAPLGAQLLWTSMPFIYCCVMYVYRGIFWLKNENEKKRRSINHFNTHRIGSSLREQPHSRTFWSFDLGSDIGIQLDQWIANFTKKSPKKGLLRFLDSEIASYLLKFFFLAMHNIKERTVKALYKATPWGGGWPYRGLFIKKAENLR